MWRCVFVYDCSCSPVFKCLRHTQLARSSVCSSGCCVNAGEADARGALVLALLRCRKRMRRSSSRSVSSQACLTSDAHPSTLIHCSHRGFRSNWLQVQFLTSARQHSFGEKSCGKPNNSNLYTRKFILINGTGALTNFLTHFLSFLLLKNCYSRLKTRVR